MLVSVPSPVLVFVCVCGFVSVCVSVAVCACAWVCLCLFLYLCLCVQSVDTRFVMVVRKCGSVLTVFSAYLMQDLLRGDDSLLADPWLDGDFLPLHAFLRAQWKDCNW